MAVLSLIQTIEQAMFNVKRLLEDHGCANAYWIGNDEHALCRQFEEPPPALLTQNILHGQQTLMRLTLDLLEKSASFTNCLKERELDLRGRGMLFLLQATRYRR